MYTSMVMFDELSRRSAAAGNYRLAGGGAGWACATGFFGFFPLHPDR
jgi:hypothetical protein